MKITLNDEEVKAALMKAIEAKTQHCLGECRDEDCYFTGTDSNDDEVEVFRVEFHCNFESSFTAIHFENDKD